MSETRNVPLPLTEEDEYWDGPSEGMELIDPVWESNAVLERSYVTCPRCKGTGMDRWEEDECQTCFGEGQVLNDLPNIPPNPHRF